jgi:uncharacterized protein YbjT (DUF2867 family)
MTAMDQGARPYAVIGATGQQGSAVVEALLATDAPVRAVVRNPDSERAQELAERGVQIAVGDQDNPEQMAGALADVEALFMMMTFTGAAGTEGEVTRGQNVAEAAARAHVPRVVYSSVGGAERQSGVPHFESKRRVEERLAELLPASFIRPTFFMENLQGMIAGDHDDGEFVLRLPLPADVSLQMVAVRDIGVVAAAALTQPEALHGSALEIAGDVLTGPQMAQRIGAHLGRKARFEALPVEVLDDDDQKTMFRWFAETPAYAADWELTRQLDPDVWDLSGWLEHGT